MLTEIRRSLRRLAKTPGYTAVALLTLAIGIGACTAVFSIVNAVVLKPIALPASQQLMAVRVILPAYAQAYPTLPVNARFYQEWRDGCPAFSNLALLDRSRSTLTGLGEPIRVSAARVSANLFATLRIAPALGRAFAADEAGANKANVAIITDHFWHAQLSANPAAIGRTITLNQQPVTVIGVLPPDFHLPKAQQYLTGQVLTTGEPEIYTLKRTDADELNDIVGRFNYEVVGRLAPGATPTAALAQMNVIAARLAKESGSGLEVRGFLAPLQEAVVGPARRGLFVLLGAIGAVLLVACLNLSMLGLARAERRSHDFAVRAALGATRGTLVREALLETLLLSAAGGALGCLVAYWGLDVLVALAPAELPRLAEVKIDGAVLAFAVGATLLTSLVAGIIPAVRMARANAIDALRSASGRSQTGGLAARRLRHLLIGIEAGVSTVLLAVAALLGASFVRLMTVDPGFRAAEAITSTLSIPYAKYNNDAAQIAYHRRLVAAVAATPGVSHAAVATALPLQGETWIDAVWAPGDTRPAAERPQTNVRFVSADFFAALGIPLLDGRTFADTDQGHHRVVLSAQLAARLFPGQNPIGRQVLRGDNEGYEVIGVAGDVRAEADHSPVPVLYQPFWEWPPMEVVLIARLSQPVAAIGAAIRQAIHQVDPDVPIGRFETMRDILDTSVAQRRFQLRLVAAFALSALTLVALGLYGVVAHGVTQRTREIGIRLAFGAEPGSVQRLMLRQGLAPVLWGLLGGTVAALAGGRVVAGLLYDTNPRNPAVLAGVAALLALVAGLSCWLSGRRATRVDPMTALRAD